MRRLQATFRTLNKAENFLSGRRHHRRRHCPRLRDERRAPAGPPSSSPATPTSRASGLTASTRSPLDLTPERTHRHDTAHPAHRRRAQRRRRPHRDDQPGSRPGADRTRRRTEGPGARGRRRCRTARRRPRRRRAGPGPRRTRRRHVHRRQHPAGSGRLRRHARRHRQRDPEVVPRHERLRMPWNSPRESALQPHRVADRPSICHR